MKRFESPDDDGARRGRVSDGEKAGTEPGRGPRRYTLLTNHPPQPRRTCSTFFVIQLSSGSVAFIRASSRVLVVRNPRLTRLSDADVGKTLRRWFLMRSVQFQVLYEAPVHHKTFFYNVWLRLPAWRSQALTRLPAQVTSQPFDPGVNQLITSGRDRGREGRGHGAESQRRESSA